MIVIFWLIVDAGSLDSNNWGQSKIKHAIL